MIEYRKLSKHMQTEIAISIQKNQLSPQRFVNQVYINPLFSIPGSNQQKVKVIFSKGDVQAIIGKNDHLRPYLSSQNTDTYKPHPKEEEDPFEGLSKQKLLSLKCLYPKMSAKLDKYIRYVENSPKKRYQMESHQEE